ncbi:MAG: GvpL/GvpF family gas vesicle protein [Candidatus Atribacteria bacterium]|nr:GvpL/GvpF family gas vesicle protein [Candidatus Atribacteria bacterium]
MSEGRYIYGIIKNTEGKNVEPFSISTDEGVYTINYKDISCVVSNSPIQDYTSMLKETLGRLLIKHQTIIEKIMKDYTIIPMKFGTFVADNDEVIKVLKRGYSKFRELFSMIDGKIELDLTAAWIDLNSIMKEISEKDKQIREFKTEIIKKPPSQNLQDRIKIGMMIKDELDKKKEKEQAYIIECLKEFTIDFQKHSVMDDKMILNCAFLIEKRKESDFDIKLKTLDEECKQKINFRCIGPLPSYSFFTCQLKRVEYKQIEQARKLLGLEAKLSLEKIKDSYRKIAQKNHPDKDSNNLQLEEDFEKITQAYQLLKECYKAENIDLENDKQSELLMVEMIRV